MNVISTPARAGTAFWLLLCIGLAAGIGLETDWGTRFQWQTADVRVAPEAFSKPVLSDRFSLMHPDQYLEITLRPMFVVTRRPAPLAPQTDTSKPSMQKGQFILLGTTIVPEGKFAFLREKAGNKSRVVAEGKEINGIMVKTVRAEQVVLTQGDDSEVLMLQMNKGGPAAPALPPGGRGAPLVPQMAQPGVPAQ